jgi:hypothetical protein
VTADPLNMDAVQLQQEVLRLRTRTQELIALLRVLLVVLKISRFALDQTRLSDGKDKRSLLRVIDRSRSALPLRSVLRIIRLSPSRYHHWNRAQQCPLDDRPSCPRLSPQQPRRKVQNVVTDSSAVGDTTIVGRRRSRATEA